MSNEEDSWDAAFAEVMRKMESGELYEEERQAMLSTGVDPDKPLEIKFKDGSTLSVTPDDQIKHLKPRGKKT